MKLEFYDVKTKKKVPQKAKMPEQYPKVEKVTPTNRDG
jgi:hypothetical protein